MSAEAGDDTGRSFQVPDDIVKLADWFGIADPEVLQDALANALDAAEEVYVATFVLAEMPAEGAAFTLLPPVCEADRGQATDVVTALSSAQEAAKHSRLSKLVDELRRELTEDFGALAQVANAYSLRQELDRYAAYLAQMRFREPQTRRGKPRAEISRVFVVELAKAWPELTGQQPTAWRDSCSPKPGGQFYKFLRVLWPKHGPEFTPLPVKLPSAPTVHRWLEFHNSASDADF